MPSDNLRFPLHDAGAARILLRALIAAPTCDPAILARAIHDLTPKEVRALELVAGHIAHACTLEQADPWTSHAIKRES